MPCLAVWILQLYCCQQLHTSSLQPLVETLMSVCNLCAAVLPLNQNRLSCCTLLFVQLYTVYDTR